MIIKINVAERKATLQDSPVLVCGNATDEVQFTFDSEWSKYTAKTARFVYEREGRVVYQDVPFTGTSAKIPALANTREVRVGVFAEDIVTTTPAVVSCEKSIKCGTGMPEAPAPDVYAEIMRLFNSTYIDTSTTVVEQIYKPDSLNPMSGVAMAQAMNSAANVIKGTAQGKALRLDGVSPVEHSVSITKNGLSSGSAKVTRYGKNLWYGRDSKSVVQGANVELTGYMSYYFETDPPAGVTYTFTADIESADTDATTCMVLVKGVAGGTVASAQLPRGARTSLTFKAEEAIKYITLYSSNTNANGSGDTAKYSNIQLEVGSGPTDFEEYKSAETYEATAKTIKSIAPTMTLFTDVPTATLTCEYNKDTGKALESVKADILAEIQGDIDGIAALVGGAE